MTTQCRTWTGVNPGQHVAIPSTRRICCACSDQRELDLRRLMLRFQLLRVDAASDFDSAERMYLRCGLRKTSAPRHRDTWRKLVCTTTAVIASGVECVRAVCRGCEQKSDLLQSLNTPGA